MSSIREIVAWAVAFADNTITAKGHKELRWPKHWDKEEADEHRKVADAAIAAFLGAAKAEGWQLVPRKLTEKMDNSGAVKFTVRAAYRAMLAAAPKFEVGE